MSGYLVSQDQNYHKSVLFMSVDTDTDVTSHPVEKLHSILFLFSAVFQQQLTYILPRFYKTIES